MPASVARRVPPLDREERVLDWGRAVYRGDLATRHRRSVLTCVWFLTTKRLWFVVPATAVAVRRERIRTVTSRVRWPLLHLEITTVDLDGGTARHELFERWGTAAQLRAVVRRRSAGSSDDHEVPITSDAPR